jgi:hypothetical protein
MLAALPPGVPLQLRQVPDSFPCPLAGEAVAAGFPSPADDYVEARIDLNIELIPSPLSTFFMRVSGDAMRGDGILDGDLLVIDRSIDARPGMAVVATCGGTHEGDFAVPGEAMAIGVVIALLGGMVAGLLPAWRAYRLKPAEALRRL